MLNTNIIKINRERKQNSFLLSEVLLISNPRKKRKSSVCSLSLTVNPAPNIQQLRVSLPEVLWRKSSFQSSRLDTSQEKKVNWHRTDGRVRRNSSHGVVFTPYYEGRNSTDYLGWLDIGNFSWTRIGFRIVVYQIFAK